VSDEYALGLHPEVYSACAFMVEETWLSGRGSFSMGSSGSLACVRENDTRACFRLTRCGVDATNQLRLQLLGVIVIDFIEFNAVDSISCRTPGRFMVTLLRIGVVCCGGVQCSLGEARERNTCRD
jgi:hypothetical protein